MTSNEDGQKVKTNFTFPSQVTYNKDQTFSGTFTKFDSDSIKFDQTTI